MIIEANKTFAFVASKQYEVCKDLHGEPPTTEVEEVLQRRSQQIHD
jgi:hypothetical protein